MIPQDFIDDLLGRVDIVEVVRARVDLKRAGREWRACCPFHNEKTPSFNVVPHKQFYHCFGCGAHGNALRFIMDHDRLEFPAAVEVLAGIAGVEIPEQAGDRQSGRNKALYASMDKAQALFRQALTADSPAMAYLQQRGVSEAMIQRFELGFAPPGWDFLSRQLKDLAAAEQAGLLVRKDADRYYDRFRNRLMFPIRDSRGRIVAFGGRTLEDDPAKYLNSPETPIFHKGRMAYGLYEARQAQSTLEQIIVVEGYMDVIALAQHGFDNAVATLGTATTPEHIRLFSRQTTKTVFCFDGDAAGQRAADRALDVCLGNLHDGMDIRFLFLPDKEDPDSLVHAEGADGFQRRLVDAVPLSERLLQRWQSSVDMSSAEGRAALLEQARKALEPIQAPAFRSLLLQRLEELTQVRQQTLNTLIGGQRKPATDIQRRKLQAPSRMTPVRRAIVLLLTYPSCAENVTDIEGLAASEVPGTTLLSEMLDRLHHNPKLHCAGLIHAYAGRPEENMLGSLALVDPEIDEMSARQEFMELCAKLLRESRKSELQELLDAARNGTLDTAGRERLKALNQSRKPPSN